MFARGENSLFENAEHLDLLIQLQQAMPTMRQLDDVFQWLASTIVYRFDGALAQFWASSRLTTESDAHHLLAGAMQDPSVPERVVMNEEIRQVLERCVANQPAPFFFPLEQAVSSYQATRLKRYGFYYGGFAFLESALLPTQPKTASFPQRGPAPVAITALLFFRQVPGPDFWDALHVLFEGGMTLAAEHGLTFTPEAEASLSEDVPLEAPPVSRASTPATPTWPTWPEAASTPSQPEAVPPLDELIPRRRQDPDLLLARNPFSRAAVISDAHARRLHAAIDGRATVSDLRRSTHLSAKEAYTALHILLKQQCIEIFDPRGRPVKASLFFKGY